MFSWQNKWLVIKWNQIKYLYVEQGLTWQRSIILTPATHWVTRPVSARFTILDASWYLVHTSLGNRNRNTLWVWYTNYFHQILPNEVHNEAKFPLPVGKVGNFFLFNFVAVMASVVTHFAVITFRLCFAFAVELSNSLFTFIVVHHLSWSKTISFGLVRKNYDT